MKTRFLHLLKELLVVAVVVMMGSFWYSIAADKNVDLDKPLLIHNPNAYGPITNEVGEDVELQGLTQGIGVVVMMTKSTPRYGIIVGRTPLPEGFEFGTIYQVMVKDSHEIVDCRPWESDLRLLKDKELTEEIIQWRDQWMTEYVERHRTQNEFAMQVRH